MSAKSKKMSATYILDNGAYSAKVGTSLSKQAEVIPNCIMKVKSERRRPFVGDQINDCRDASGLFYILPFQKGYIVNWDVQKTVWDYIFSKDPKPRLSEMPICVTEPMFNFQFNQEAMDEIFFEEYECCGILRLTAPDLAAYQYSQTDGHNTKTLLVIDTGYSFTHLVPFIEGKKYLPGVKRIDIGGKVLTNHLKEIISYRQLHVMDETYVINQAKEDACYVSDDFRTDMAEAAFKDKRNRIIREYVLPDYSLIKRGYIRRIYDYNSDKPLVHPKHTEIVENKESTSEDTPAPVEQQTIILNNERISIPEILFNPSDIGISQMGIAEAVVECIKECPEAAKFQLLGNIVVVGGNAMFPNFKRRLFKEIRQRFDGNIAVNLYAPPNPVTYPWCGGKTLSSSEDFYSYVVSKEAYEECGHNFTRGHLETFKI